MSLKTHMKYNSLSDQFISQYLLHSVPTPPTLVGHLWYRSPNKQLISFVVSLTLLLWPLKPAWWWEATFGQGKASYLSFSSLIPELKETQ